MLEVLRWYVNKYDGNIRLHVIGGLEGAMEPYMRTIRERIREYGLDGNIEFAGSVSDTALAAYYRGCDAMLCCSFHEGFCVPVAEAQYFGLPVIALRYGAVPETMGKEQLLFGADPAESAAAIHALRENSGYREYLAEKGRRNYDGRFSFGVLKDRFFEVINSVTDPETARTPAEPQEGRAPRLAFVTPWFAEGIPGGAEAECRGLVFQMKNAGCDVEVLTTRIKEFRSDWNLNYWPPCTEMIKGVPVTRFDADLRDEAAFAAVNAKLMEGGRVSGEEEKTYLDGIVNSDGLCAYIRDNYGRYDLFVFIPYMFGTTYRGVQECLEKAVVIPCLHDEAYIHMDGYKNVFNRVAGMVFHSHPEQELANGVYDLSGVEQEVLGGIVETEFSFSPGRFRRKYGINGPFILYAGRKDAGKGVDELLGYFKSYKRRHKDSALKLVLIGGGETEIPKGVSGDVLDLGFVSRQDKYDACSAAVCLCNMSRMESFSLVIMESWLCGRPVIVNAACAVTADFAERFGGGFSVSSYAEFEESLNFYLENPEEAGRMGERGCGEVRARYSREAVTEKYLDFFGRIIRKNRFPGAGRSINIEGIMSEIRSGGTGGAIWTAY